MQLIEGPVDLRVPVLPASARHFLPGGAVPGQPRQADCQAGLRQVLSPRAQRLGAAGESVTEQDSGRAALVAVRFRAWQYWHDLVLSDDLGCLYPNRRTLDQCSAHAC